MGAGVAQKGRKQTVWGRSKDEGAGTTGSLGSGATGGGNELGKRAVASVWVFLGEESDGGGTGMGGGGVVDRRRGRRRKTKRGWNRGKRGETGEKLGE